MKKIIIISAMLATLVVSSCKKDLSEVPLDFYTPENSFNNKAQFESALAGIYLAFRTDMYAFEDAAKNYDMLGMDLDLANVESNASAQKTQYFNWITMNADNPVAVSYTHLTLPTSD